MWTAPGLLAVSNAEISSVALVPDGQTHSVVLWVESTVADNLVTSAIAAARWDGQQWTQPFVVLSARQGEISQLRAATDGRRLFVVWSEDSVGQIYFSWANLGRAAVASEWAQPRPLAPDQTTATTPSLVVGASGDIFVAYALSINENRGIYLIKSQDGGANWAAPVKVFDAAAAGWIMTGAPQVVESGGKVYVHCASGVGRAPTMAAAYLVSTGLSLDEAWTLIRKTRPFVNPTPPQVAALEQFAREEASRLRREELLEHAERGKNYG